MGISKKPQNGFRMITVDWLLYTEVRTVKEQFF